MDDPHIFKTDKKTIDTQKVTFSIWKNRANAEYVKEFTETLRYVYALSVFAVISCPFISFGNPFIDSIDI